MRSPACAESGRDRATSAATQVEAELGAWKVSKELTGLLQRLGILPLAAQEIRADLTHRVEEVPSSGDLRDQVQTLQEVWQAAGAPRNSSLRSQESRACSQRQRPRKRSDRSRRGSRRAAWTWEATDAEVE